jgi:hypothetical protein
MTDYVSYDATDNPTALIELSTSAGHHIVEHYHGDDSAPRLLTWMEDRIDEVAGTDKWLGKRVGNERVCQLPDGTTRPLSWD